MAEYYPLLSKAVGSLPNSSPETRRIVYERARKALIGQLRTLHPPVPDEEIDKESVALDQAIERLEAELAAGATAAPPASPTPSSPPAAPPPAAASPPSPPAKPTLPTRPPPPPRPGDGIPVAADKRPLAPLRPRPPVAKTPPPAPDTPPPAEADVIPPDAGVPPAISAPSSQTAVEADGPPGADDKSRLKPPQRPIAPQPASARGPKRRLWIVPVALALIVGGVGFAAWKLRDHPETIVQNKPAEPSQSDSGKIAERVGNPPPQDTSPSEPPPSSNQPAQPAQQAAPQQAPTTEATPQQGTPAAKNPELPVAHRAALLVEAPSEPNKVKTYLGTVVWKLNNVPQGQNDTVGVAVEADIDLPDDKLKAVVTFAKNTEASLPASHTINVKFIPEPGSPTGDVKQISVPQMRPESSPGGEPLAGVTVQIVPNSFLVGLSPGNAEAANTDLIRRLQWVDIPMLLESGKIAKLTFEKSDSGQRDLVEALNAWQKQ